MENDLPAGPDLRLLFDEASRTLSVSLAPDPQFPRIDALWLATAPIDMRMGTERLLARVVQVFGVAQAHQQFDHVLFFRMRAW